MTDKTAAPRCELPFRNREERCLFEEERLTLSVTTALVELMEALHLTRANLAERLGTSRANITQLLHGHRNMTMHTLARLAFEMEHRVEVQFSALHQIAFKPVDVAEPVVRSSRRAVQAPEVQTQLEFGEGNDLGDTNEYLAMAA